MTNAIRVYLSADPTSLYPKQILGSRLVTDVRMNSGAPVSEPKDDVIRKFTENMTPKIPWLDLKCRELRLVNQATLPDEYLVLNHRISVKTPCTLYFNDGKGLLVIDDVIDEHKLTVRPPKKMTGTNRLTLGKGASVSIPDSSLAVHDYFTNTDREYIDAAMDVGLHNYLLSYVESESDIRQLLDVDPEASIIAKIESKKGLLFASHQYRRFRDNVRLLLARGDLYIELDRPHEILRACSMVIESDPKAIAASRILESFLEQRTMPRCADLCDIGFLLQLGYRSFLLGDELCADHSILSSALGLIQAVERDYLV